MPQPILIRDHHLAPGDYVVATAAIRDLVKKYRSRYIVAANTSTPDVWVNNPHIWHGVLPGLLKPLVLPIHYHGLLHQKDPPHGGVHFLYGPIDYLNGCLKLQGANKIVLTEFKPDLHLSPEKKAKRPIETPYWLVMSGGKSDFPVKQWGAWRWQQVVDILAGKVQFVQAGAKGGLYPIHTHPPLRGTINLVGKTSFRALMQLVYHANGVSCGITCLMHVAAAFNRPAVIVAGGREGTHWEAYTSENRLTTMRRGIPNWNPPTNDTFIPQRFLHTMDKFPCCMGTAGCWKNKAVGKGKVCLNVVSDNGNPIPACMKAITPEEVATAILSYTI